MSSDIDIYEDENFDFSAIMGGWGVRFHVTTKRNGRPFIPTESGVLGELVTLSTLDQITPTSPDGSGALGYHF